MSAKRVLVVDDEEKIARLLTQQLARAGYDAHAAHSGRAALAYAEEHRPDLVTLDVCMPDMNGYELCQELRRRFDRETLPIVMVTALDRPMDELRGLAHGADAYLTKPFEFSELLQTIAALVGPPQGGEAPVTGTPPGAP